MKTVRDKIIKMLMDNPSNSDFSNKLIANFWYKEIIKSGADPKELSAFDFLNMIANYKLTSSETIRRTSADIQKDHKELRGKNYKKRQTTLQNKVRKELGYETY